MQEHRPFASLGRFRNDWLDANYHFSFSNYFDPKRTQWGALRVWNDDTIEAGTGFAPHSHADMEIITYVRTGAITHQDSLGNTGWTAAGDVQVMSAGTGITHAEYNREDEATTLFQIWLLPKMRGARPSWGAAKFPKGDRAGKLVTLVSGFEDDLANGALPIRQDARLLAATMRPGETIEHTLTGSRRAYAVLARGDLDLNGTRLTARDGLAIADIDRLTAKASAGSELLIVEA
jgi:redox-sensitive bicupin YhaK (pirin superfamily)